MCVGGQGKGIFKDDSRKLGLGEWHCRKEGEQVWDGGCVTRLCDDYFPCNCWAHPLLSAEKKQPRRGEGEAPHTGTEWINPS